MMKLPNVSSPFRLWLNVTSRSKYLSVPALIFSILLASCGQVFQGPGATEFHKARTLIEANCADCPGARQEALEKGIQEALKAQESGYSDRAAILRLLVNGYAALAINFLKPDNPERGKAMTSSRKALSELIALKPTDANLRFEYIHKIVGKSEWMWGNLDERIAMYRQVLAIDPHHEKARSDLARDLAQIGEIPEAISILKSLVQPGDSPEIPLYTKRLDELLKDPHVIAPATLMGEISRGEDFVQPMEPGLLFRLRAVTDGFKDSNYIGWEIQVVPKESQDRADYSAVLAFPLHGRNSNSFTVDRNVSAHDLAGPGTRAMFRFVRNKADYSRAAADIEVVSGHTPLPPGEDWQVAQDRALNDLGQIPYCNGALRILDSRLTPSTSASEGTQFIDWIKFEVSVCH